MWVCNFLLLLSNLKKKIEIDDTEMVIKKAVKHDFYNILS